ncbi:MAG: HNH endonuclease signature motif containing protein [Gammaproteobacteria bacterium]|nr:HNH endonuclease signature motif containing protein [Gammaproteobacteria bacterium]
MGSLYLNKLSKEEKNNLVKRLHEIQEGNCFICGDPINLDIHRKDIDIDHVIPIKSKGKDGPENFAITHATCNRSKQDSNLHVARILAEFNKINENIPKDENRSANLGDILAEYGGGKYELSVKIAGGSFQTSFPKTGNNDIITTPIFKDQISGFDSVFLNLPIQYIHHDSHINPRSIGKNLGKLVKEFHKKLPQLHVALAWIDTDKDSEPKVLVFDGQHKAAAQIMIGAKNLPVRVFINPDKGMLLTANTHAGTTLHQVAFDKSVQRNLGNSLLKERITRYRKDKGRPEDDESFTERDLANHFKGESREMKRYVLDWVRNEVTTHPENKLRHYIEYGGRGKDKPLSYSTIEKTFYSLFVYGELLETPFNFKQEEGTNPRRLEIEQIVRLMNIIAEEIFIEKFDLSIGIGQIEGNIQKNKYVPEPHLCAFRMAKEERIRAWLRYIPKIIQSYFVTTGESFDEKKMFQYPIPNQCWENIKHFIDALKKFPFWVNKDLSTTVFGGKQTPAYWQTIFETGKTPDGTEVIGNKGINYMEMIGG